jgi:NTE family protein
MLQPLRLSWSLPWLLTALAMTGAWHAPSHAQTSPNASAFATATAMPRVVVVLAGGGAKGYAHLAVLRRLEKDKVKIARLVGTSMGAVIGGLYASGMSTDEIERVIGQLDPGKVALDQLDRLELPLRTRAYQRQYPIDLEFGIKEGTLSFARGVSDGQRFLALLQQLTAHVSPHANFDDLKIPFRAVATRYRDGELTVFKEGSLHLAIRASMAAPGVFAPVEIDGETFVDGGLVANLPVEVALQEGGDILVASYLGQENEHTVAAPSNALAVANQMLDILIRQNEKRNLALLRPQDVLVSPQLGNLGFSDFRQVSKIVDRGEAAVQAVDERFALLARHAATGDRTTTAADHKTTPRFDGRDMVVHSIRVSGTKDLPIAFVERAFEPLKNQPFSAQEVRRLVDKLYTSGNFERVSYSLDQIRDDRYELVIDVNEKPYGPHYFKTSLGFSSEMGGVNQFSVGLGYRRPWLNDAGLELAVDSRVGTQSELALRLYQPWRSGIGFNTHVAYQSNLQPIYTPLDLNAVSASDKLAYAQVASAEFGANVSYEWERKSLVRLGWVASDLSYQIDTARTVVLPLHAGGEQRIDLNDRQIRYGGLKFQWISDQLDSVNFPEKGQFINASAEHGLVGTHFQSYAFNGRWAYPFKNHVLNLGLNLGLTQASGTCADCRSPSNLYLGGFQNMGAYRMGQLVGDRLAHAYATYMYRLSDGGLLRQRTYWGVVGEAGDIWFNGQPHTTRYSGTLFLAVDSKIGDVYLGLARGSQGISNAFVQLGRRFSF